MFERIKEIIDDSIGEPKRDGDGWLEYNCPYCAMEKGVDCDNKYNLAVNYGEDMTTKPFFHCWRCNTAGKLSKLVKDFGSRERLHEYYRELKNIKNSLLYRLDFNNFLEDKFELEQPIELPEDFRSLTIKDKYSKEPYEYLTKERGLNDYFINYYNIGYVPYWSKDKQMRNRIIIPSYDKFGDLNYFIARDFTGKRIYRKYNNPNIKKTQFVFNEDKINWYEDVTLVEGVFDHMVIPNSIPLLGKVLKSDYATFETLIANAKSNVNILLDDDAYTNAKKIYRLLNSTSLRDKVRIIECPFGYDASDIYKKFKKRGVVRLLNKAKQLDDFEIVNL